MKTRILTIICAISLVLGLFITSSIPVLSTKNWLTDYYMCDEHSYEVGDDYLGTYETLIGKKRTHMYETDYLLSNIDSCKHYYSSTDLYFVKIGLSRGFNSYNYAIDYREGEYEYYEKGHEPILRWHINEDGIPSEGVNIFRVSWRAFTTSWLKKQISNGLFLEYITDMKDDNALSKNWYPKEQTYYTAYDYSTKYNNKTLSNGTSSIDFVNYYKRASFKKNTKGTNKINAFLLKKKDSFLSKTSTIYTKAEKDMETLTKNKTYKDYVEEEVYFINKSVISIKCKHVTNDGSGDVTETYGYTFYRNSGDRIVNITSLTKEKSLTKVKKLIKEKIKKKGFSTSSISQMKANDFNFYLNEYGNVVVCFKKGELGSNKGTVTCLLEGKNNIGTYYDKDTLYYDKATKKWVNLKHPIGWTTRLKCNEKKYVDASDIEEELREQMPLWQKDFTFDYY